MPNANLPLISDQQLAAIAQEIQKGMVSTAVFSGGGKLNEAQSDKFIDYVVDESVLKNDARIERFRNEEAKIEKINVGQKWVMYPKREATDPRFRAGIETSYIQLRPEDVIVPYEITDRFKRWNIEGEAGADTVVRLFAKAFANNLEMLYINGNTLGPAILEKDYTGAGSTTQYMKNLTLALFDGWFRRADQGHLKDFAGAGVGPAIFAAMIRMLPTKFRRQRQDLRFYMPSDLQEYYLESLSNRPTALGDAAVGGIKHKPFNITLAEVPLYDAEPETVEHVQLNGTTTVDLKYGPISDVVVTTSTLYKSPENPYTVTTDYTVDLVNGTITRVGGGTIGDGQTVKVTYRTLPQILLTSKQNLIVAIGKDITIERQRNIYTGVDEFVITAAVDVQFEENDALVKGVNVGLEAAAFPTP